MKWISCVQCIFFCRAMPHSTLQRRLYLHWACRKATQGGGGGRASGAQQFVQKTSRPWPCIWLCGLPWWHLLEVTTKYDQFSKYDFQFSKYFLNSIFFKIWLIFNFQNMTFNFQNIFKINFFFQNMTNFQYD